MAGKASGELETRAEDPLRQKILIRSGLYIAVAETRKGSSNLQRLEGIYFDKHTNICLLSASHGTGVEFLG